MEKKDLVQIGKVAKMFHLSVGTLRHYEKAGLLIPEYIDPDSGYRYYSTSQFEILNTIRSLRVLDMPLDQIADFLHNRDIEKMVGMLKQQKEAVICKQNELKVIEKKIENRIKMIQDAVSSETDVIKIRTVSAIRVAWLRNTLSLHSYLDLETSIRQLEENQNDTVIWLGKVGVGIAQEKLLHQEYEEYDMVFLALDQEDEYEGKTELWPEATCVTLRFCGSHKDAPAQYKKLMKFINNHNMKIAGFSREITMIDNGLTNDVQRFVTEIQIPIEVMEE